MNAYAIVSTVCVLWCASMVVLEIKYVSNIMMRYLLLHNFHPSLCLYQYLVIYRAYVSDSNAYVIAVF